MNIVKNNVVSFVSKHVRAHFSACHTGPLRSTVGTEVTSFRQSPGRTSMTFCPYSGMQHATGSVEPGHVNRGTGKYPGMSTQSSQVNTSTILVVITKVRSRCRIESRTLIQSISCHVHQFSISKRQQNSTIHTLVLYVEDRNPN